MAFTLFIVTLQCKLTYHDSFPTIHCIMITGHTPQRSAYARLAIKNFDSQVYPFKHLIIINQSNIPLVVSPHPKVTEIISGKTSMSLGALRNHALDSLPEGAYFTTWDDDDWRSPTYLLDFAYASNSPRSIPALSARYEYNIISGLTWSAHKPKGFVLFCAPNLKDVRYLDKPTMEDLEILDAYKTKGYSIVPLNNKPNSYIRLVHGNNTSTYVDINKDYMITNPEFYEQPTTLEEKALIVKIMTPYVNVPI
jgi:hypothetical protein